MHLVTWNVNSIRARLERTLEWLDANAPDVVCLQELKVTDDDFPLAPFAERGWHAATHGQKTYNGVAILARTEPRDVVRGLGDDVDDPQARFICATVDGIRVASVYVPNGSEVGSEKWDYKRAFYRRLAAWLKRNVRKDAPFALCGDLNVAPDERDVENPDQWASTVLFHPDARADLKSLLDTGLEDAFRLHHDEGGLYSWWDYRRLGFPKNDGLRIDHVLVTEALAGRITGSRIDREARKGQKPSDHAPVLVEID